MKSSRLISFVVIILGLGGLSPRPVYSQTDYSIPITFTVTQTAINRAIAWQWGSLTFTKTWSGTYQGLTYSIQLDRPTVLLSPNTVKISIALVIQSPAFSGTIILTPALTIPNTTLSAPNLIAQYQNLHQEIMSKTQSLDSRLQYLIEQALSPIDWLIARGQALTVSSSRWSESSDLRWKGLPTLTVSIADDKIDLMIVPVVTATPPSYEFSWSRSGPRTLLFRVSSNDLFSEDLIALYDNGAGQVQCTPESYVPVQAIFDQSTQRYVAIMTLTTTNSIAPGTYYTRFRFNRGSAEPIFSFQFQTYAFPTGWSVSGNVGQIWGE